MQVQLKRKARGTKQEKMRARKGKEETRQLGKEREHDTHYYVQWRASFPALCRALFFSAAPAHLVAQGIISFLQREAERVPRTTRAGHVFDLLFPDIED